MHLLNARRPNGVSVLDFSEVRILSFEAYAEEHLMAIHIRKNPICKFVVICVDEKRKLEISVISTHKYD